MNERVANTVENLRQLLTEIYVSGAIRPGLPDSEWDRIHTAILDAAEGRPFPSGPQPVKTADPTTVT